MNKRIILFVLFGLLSVYGFSQSNTLKKNSIFVEVGGMAILYSINYERVIYANNNIGITAGIGYSPSLLDFEYSPRVPMQVKFFKKNKQHRVEIGAAVTPMIFIHKRYSYDGYKKVTRDLVVGIFGQIGYKYTWPSEKSYFGIAFTPLLWDSGRPEFYPWGALRLGMNF